MQDISSETDLRVRNNLYAWKHMDAESRDNIDDIVDTLTPDGPYAYTVAKERENGSTTIPQQEFRLDRAGIRAAYEDMHRFTLSLGIDPLAEINSDWYTFVFGLGHGMVKATGAITRDSQTCVLFPTMAEHGIKGELFWFRTCTEPYTGGRTTARAAELAILTKHNELVEALRQGDFMAAGELFHPDSQVGVRDYVNETGTVIPLAGRSAFQSHLKRFYDIFNVIRIDVVERLATDWCIFAELRWIVESREKRDVRFSFHTANHGEVRSDGLFASLIGHGTDLTEI